MYQQHIELDHYIKQRNFSQLSASLKTYEPAEVGALLAKLDDQDALTVFKNLPDDRAAAVFKYLSHQRQLAVVDDLSVTEQRLASLLNALSPDDRTAFFSALPEALVESYLAILDPKERKNAIHLLSYPADTVGRLVTTDYLALRSDWTVEQALRHIRRFGKDSETINVIYIVDRDWRLLDDLRLREVLLASPEASIASLMDNHFIALSATEDREKAVRIFRDYDRAALPVVDDDGVLVGIVTSDDMLDVAEEEATEDMQLLGGLEALDSPYMNTPLSVLMKKRSRWLVVLFIGEMFTATAMGFFEAELAQAVVLGLFLPLIISSGGNSGSQAASLIIRALAVGDVRLRDWWRVMHREIISGLFLGSLLGLLGFLRVVVWANVFGIYGEHWLPLGITVALTLIGVVTWGTLAGSMLPFILKRFGADPAVSSAPFVATLVDVTGLVIYFSIAAVVLSGTLL